jgi:glycine betaine/proline transport system substrate-binding protein
MKYLRIFAGLVAAMMIAMTPPAMAKDKVVIGEQSWTGAVAIQNIMKAVIEKYLDGEVSFLLVAEEAMYPALDKGDGSLDVVPDLWSQHTTAMLNEYVLPGSKESIRLNKTPYKGTEGIFVPGYVQDQYNIRKLADLAKPEVAKIFDTDGDGKGEYWAGAVGWEATNHSMVRAKSYGFDKLFTASTVEQPVFLAQLSAAYQRKEPIVFYYWTPEWIFASYDLRMLEEPAFDGWSSEDKKTDPMYKADGCYKFYQPGNNPDWLEKSSITCAQPPTDVYVARSKALDERAPKIGKFLEQITLTPDMVNEWIYAIDQDKKDPLEVAQKWVEEHKDIVEGQWLSGLSM